MKAMPEGNAVVYCEKVLATLNGKTAHGLVRKTRRYRVRSVVDSRFPGSDAGQLLDGRPNGIPVVGDSVTAVRSRQPSSVARTVPSPIAWTMS